MIGYPFDSHLIYEDDGTPIYDRAVNSAQLRKLYRTLYSNGVLPNVDDQLVVKEKEEMIVEVSAGFCIAHGVLKWFDEPTNISIPQSQDQDRIDTIVIRMDDTTDVRSCELYVVKGTKSNNPVRPELTRTDTIWELGIADIYVPKNSYVVTQDRIYDTRPEMERCGFISPLGEFDTDFLYEQIQGDLKYFKENQEVDFVKWFEKIRGQLSEDAAGHLQNQIDELQAMAVDIYGEDGILEILDRLVADVLKVNFTPIILESYDIFERFVLSTRGRITSAQHNGKIQDGTNFPNIYIDEKKISPKILVGGDTDFRVDIFTHYYESGQKFDATMSVNTKKKSTKSGVELNLFDLGWKSKKRLFDDDYCYILFNVNYSIKGSNSSIDEVGETYLVAYNDGDETLLAIGVKNESYVVKVTTNGTSYTRCEFDIVVNSVIPEDDYNLYERYLDW